MPTVPGAQVSTNKGQEAVTPQAAAPSEQMKPLGKEERVEYRDQDGNLLGEEEVQSLMAEGKASFSTKYETETKLVDEYGNIVPNQEGAKGAKSAQSVESVAPEHPDSEGADPDTSGPAEASRKPASAEVPVVPAENKEENLSSPEAQPASEASEATK